MKKVIFAASILLVASLAMTGCGAAREQAPAPSAQAAAAYVETIPATEAARTQAASEAMTTAAPAPAEAKPAETTAPVTAATEAAVVTTAATTAKPAATTAATTAKPAATTAASTSKSAAATEATLPNPPCPGFEKELAPAPAPATEMAPAPAPEMAPAPAPATEMAPAPAPEQNPIMNFIGSYSNGRAIMTVSTKGRNGAEIRISWSGSAFETSVWKMSGTVRVVGDCAIVDYTDCVKETFRYTADGTPLVDAIEYTNGSGSVTFHFLDAIWDDFQENAAEGTVFSYCAG